MENSHLDKIETSETLGILLTLVKRICMNYLENTVTLYFSNIEISGDWILKAFGALGMSPTKIQIENSEERGQRKSVYCYNNTQKPPFSILYSSNQVISLNHRYLSDIKASMSKWTWLVSHKNKNKTETDQFIVTYGLSEEQQFRLLSEEDLRMANLYFGAIQGVNYILNGKSESLPLEFYSLRVEGESLAIKCFEEVKK